MKSRNKKMMAVLLIAALILFVRGSMGVVWAVAGEDRQTQRQQGRTLQPSVEKERPKAAVYMTTDISPQGMMKVYEALNWTPSGKVAVKLSTGEPPAGNYLRVVYPGGMKNVGTYTVEIRFRNNYTGTVKRSFTIYPKSTSLTRVASKKKRLTVAWKKQKEQTGGYELAYSVSSRFSKQKTVIVNVKGANKTKKVISKLKAGKKYYVRIRTYKTAGGKTYYSSWSKSKPMKIKSKE